jgi:hypothetical protein
MRFIDEVGTRPLGRNLTTIIPIGFITRQRLGWLVVQLYRISTTELRLYNQQRGFDACKGQFDGRADFIRDFSAVVARADGWGDVVAWVCAAEVGCGLVGGGGPCVDWFVSLVDVLVGYFGAGFLYYELRGGKRVRGGWRMNGEWVRTGWAWGAGEGSVHTAVLYVPSVSSKRARALEK